MRRNYPRADDNSLVSQEIVENVTCKKRELQYDLYFDERNVRVAIEVDWLRVGSNELLCANGLVKTWKIMRCVARQINNSFTTRDVQEARHPAVTSSRK